FDIRHSTFDIRHSTFDIRHSNYEKLNFFVKPSRTGQFGSAKFLYNSSTTNKNPKKTIIHIINSISPYSPNAFSHERNTGFSFVKKVSSGYLRNSIFSKTKLRNGFMQSGVLF
ncbi:MAG: hypothetical protein ACTTIO_06630, partial [Candidatus Fimenecus sp.]